jgi:5-(hydroxymethyl)furfural/furfural oxidase
MTYDYIIVGGGSAGSVLANRLSARSSNNVLVLEAGEDTPHGAVPPEILDSYPGTAYLNDRFIWGDLKVRTEVVSHNAPPEDQLPRLRKYEQARVLGGGSSINGQFANRGAPWDFDEWDERGATGWNWDSVLPYFRKLEHDMDVHDDYHGREGPIPIRRIYPDSWSEHTRAVSEAFGDAGFDYLEDQNGEFRDGYFPITISNAYERRVSTAIGYLGPSIRQRPNLTIQTQAVVQTLLMEGTRCVGVRASIKGKTEEFRAGEVILSCGAIHSPAHLLRAGIGPAMALQDLGLDVNINLPGVGQRLQDHPSIALASFLKPHARASEHTRRHVLIGLRYSSKMGDAPLGDMFVAVADKTSWHPVGEQLGALLMWVNKTYSEAGQVRLKSTDWHEHPEVEFNLLSDRRDLDRLVDGFRRMAKAAHTHPAVQAATELPFPACWGEKVRQVGAITRSNAIKTGIMAKLLDGPGTLRKYLIERFIMDGYTLEQLIADNDAAEDFVRTTTVGVWHASCTCRMGADNDPEAVTNNAGRVRGAEGLRVCDASIFPQVPCANTNLPTIMSAEKISDMILAGH